MEELTIRIDKWLKVARFYKQRELAAEAVESGKVRVNGERVKPAKLIKAGDELTVKHESSYLKFRIKIITDKSLSKEDAKNLYEAAGKPEPPKVMIELLQTILEQARQNQEEMKHKGRPTKKDRRILNKYKYMTND